MGALTKLTLLLKHMQFIGLLSSIDVPFPRIYIDFSSFNNLISVDPSFLNSLNANIPTITFRLLFFGVAVAIPLVIMVLTLLVFVNFTTIMWMCFAIMGIALLVFQVIASVGAGDIMGGGGDGTSGGVADPQYRYVMVAILAYCLLYRLVSKVCDRSSGSVTFIKGLLDPGMFLIGGAIAGMNELVFRIFVCIACLMGMCHIYKSELKKGFKGVGYLACVGAAVAFWLQTNVTWEHIFPDVLLIPGILILTLGIVGFIQFLLYSNSDKEFGKKFVEARIRIQNLLDRTLLAVAFFFLSSALVPVSTYCLQMFKCETFFCPFGTRFNPFLAEDAKPGPNQTAEELYCDPCIFHTDTCVQNMPFLCPPFSEDRLTFHPDTLCSDDVSLYYKIAAVIVLVVFVVVISAMYRRIIRILTSRLQEHYQKKLEYLHVRHKQLEGERSVRQARRMLREHRDNQLLHHSASSLRPGDLHNNNNDNGGGPYEQRLVLPDVPMDQTIRTPGSSSGPQPTQQQVDDDPFANSDDEFEMQLAKTEPAPMNVGAGGGLQSPLLLQNRSESQPPQRQRQMSAKSNSNGSPKSTRSRRGTLLSSFFGSSKKKSKSNVNGNHANPNGEGSGSSSSSDDDVDDLQEPSMEMAIDLVNAKVNPKASSLYNPYKMNFCYFLIAENVHRLILVAVSVFVSPTYPFSAGINFGLHLLLLAVVAGMQPYAGMWELRLAIIVSAADSLSAGYAVLLWLLPDDAVVTSDAMGIIVLLIGVVPVVAGVAWQIVEIRNSLKSPYSKQEEKLQKKEQEKTKQRIAELQEEIDHSDLFDHDDNDIARIKREIAKLKNPGPTDDEKLTDELNKSTKTSILFCFVAAGIPLLLAAMGLTIYATTQELPPRFVDGSDLLVRTDDAVLGGRESWNAFTNDCCCTTSLSPMESYNITERWVCSLERSAITINGTIARNSSLPSVLRSGPGVTVSRNRWRTTGSSGLPIRGVCALNFTMENCTVAVSAGIVELRCPSAELEAQGISTFASRVLW